MNERLKGILFAILLGVVLPALIMYFSNNTHNVQESTETTESSQADNIYISVLMDDSVVQMNLNDYLTGVVLCEMPVEFEFEALKAQAVVARTYALRRNNGAGKHNNAAVCKESNCCQGYKSVEDFLSAGGSVENVKTVKNAVLQTDGMVLTYHGELIDATYFSCSGGMTEDAVSVWGEDVPYLKATESPGEEKARHYMDTVTFSIEEFAETLSLDAARFYLEGIDEITYTSGGGVERITICGETYKGTELRKLLNLKSTAFMISSVGNTVTITTKGYGHRVGMSQYGADAMAANGATFSEILMHYYDGVEITEMRNR